jgi:hypothetical protein
MPCRPIRFLTGEDRSAEGGDQRVGAAPRAALGTHAASQPAGSFSVPPATRRDRHVSRCCRVVALGSRRVGLGGFQAPDHKDAEEGEEPQVLGEDGLGDGDRDREQDTTGPGRIRSRIQRYTTGGTRKSRFSSIRDRSMALRRRNSPWWPIQNSPITVKLKANPAIRGDGFPQLRTRLQVGHDGDPEVDDQQGDGDGRDGVAEEQDAVVLDRLGLRASF